MEALNPKLFDAAVTATTEILKFTSPSDSILSNYFKTNRELGSRERPVIADLAYAVIRNKTYLEKTSGSEDALMLCLAALNKIFGLSLKSLKSKVAARWHKDIQRLGDERSGELSTQERYSLPDEEMRVISDYPDYKVTDYGAVWKYRNTGKRYRGNPFLLGTTDIGDKEYIRISTEDGRRHWVRMEKIMEDTYPEY